eukprot:4288626-Karenia_brevis.AAC.1
MATLAAKQHDRNAKVFEPNLDATCSRAENLAKDMLEHIAKLEQQRSISQEQVSWLAACMVVCNFNPTLPSQLRRRSVTRVLLAILPSSWIKCAQLVNA